MSIIGPLKLGAIAHGGYCVARVDGRVIFVRHGLPGEQVTVKLTDTKKAKFWFGEVAEVLEASPDRVIPACPVAGLCGGCDFQHIRLEAQRQAKEQVISEQLTRIAKISPDVEVVGLAGDQDGLGWRTRMRYLVENGRVGLRAWHSDRLVPLPSQGCSIAHPDGRQVTKLIREDGQAQVVVADKSVTVLDSSGRSICGPKIVEQEVFGHTFRVRANGFWQVHPGAAAALTEAVMSFIKPKPGELALDLYCGVGLFAAALAESGAQVVGVESSKAAIKLAKQNVAQARFISSRVENSFNRLPKACDIVVLDPPRTGAGAKVVRQLARLKPRAICYVACDPSALARDVRTFAELGYRVSGLKAFDIFPMTHHVETVALLSKLDVDKHIDVEIELDELDLTSAESKATYAQIKEYVWNKFQLKVPTLYIAQIKRKCGIELREHYNKSKKEKQIIPQCTPEKEEAIMDALRHFKMIE